MPRRMIDFLVISLVISSCHLVVAQGDPIDEFAEFHVLWDFVPPKKFFSICMKVGNEVGGKSANPKVCESSCEKHVAQFKDPDAKLHCQYMALQMEIATQLEVYHGPYEFCKSMLMYQSYSLKTDVLQYVTERDLWDACTESVVNAMDAGVGLSKTEAIQQNLPLGCKEAMEGLYREHGMPLPSASIACKEFVEKAQTALSAGELSPASQGKQFCDGNSMQAVAFAKSAPSEAPSNFPLSMTDWKPKVTLAEFQRMVRKAFRNPTDAFTKYDANGDGNLDDDEWVKMGRDLGIPSADIPILSGIVDEDENGKISKDEWNKVFGVTLPELVDMSNAKYQNAEKGWKAADEDGDGILSPQEFETVCSKLGLTPENAKKLFPQVDADGNDGISQDEYKNVFGIGIPELKRRARKKFGSPKSSFKAMDTNGDGKIQPEEFKKACKGLNIPSDTAKKLLGKLDVDSSGDIDPKEWDKAMGMTAEDARNAIAEKYGANPLAMDKNGDGKLSPDEVAEGMKKSGASPEEAGKLLKDMDADGDGKLSPEEIHEGIGGADLDEARGFSHPAAESAAGISLPEFKERAKKKHGTPQAAFDAFDSSPKDGKISLEEFTQGSQSLEPPVTPENAAELFKALDKNVDNGVEPREWFETMGGCEDCKESFAVTLPEFKERAAKKSGEPQNAYKAMDQNGDGKVTPQEFDDYCQSLSPPITAEESKPLFKELDKNASGFIEPEEFFEEVGKEAFSPSPVEEASGGAGAISPGEEGVAPKKGQIGDTDGDGKISPAEKLAKTKALDNDGDGKVSPEEMKAAAAAGKLSPEEMKALDTDGDGKLSDEEARQGAAATTANAQDEKKVMDANGDGKVSPDEVAKAVASGRVPPAQVRKMDSDGDGKLSPAELERGAEAIDIAAAADHKKALDSDGDGKVSADDIAKAAARGQLAPGEVRKMDSDGDGKLSPEELKRGAEGVEADAADARAKALDSDGDGKVSADDIAKAVARGQLAPGEVRKMDSDGDGKLSQEELKRGAEAVETEAAHARKVKMKRALKGRSKAATKKMDADGDGKVSPAEMKKGLIKQGWGPAEAEKMVKDMGKDGYFGSHSWDDGYGDIDPWGAAHKRDNRLPHAIQPFGETHTRDNNLPHNPQQSSSSVVATGKPLEDAAINFGVTARLQKAFSEESYVPRIVKSQKSPLLKWQETKALEGSKPRGEAMRKFMHDTAQAKEAPIPEKKPEKSLEDVIRSLSREVDSKSQNPPSVKRQEAEVVEGSKSTGKATKKFLHSTSKSKEKQISKSVAADSEMPSDDKPQKLVSVKRHDAKALGDPNPTSEASNKLVNDTAKESPPPAKRQKAKALKGSKSALKGTKKAKRINNTSKAKEARIKSVGAEPPKISEDLKSRKSPSIKRQATKALDAVKPTNAATSKSENDTAKASRAPIQSATIESDERSAEFKKGLIKQGWSPAEAEKMVKDMGKDGYFEPQKSQSNSDKKRKIRTWKMMKGQQAKSPERSKPTSEANQTVVNDTAKPFEGVSPQEAKAQDGLQHRSEAIKKLMNDTAKGTEAPIEPMVTNPHRRSEDDVIKALAKEVYEAKSLQGLNQTTGEATKQFLRAKAKSRKALIDASTSNSSSMMPQPEKPSEDAVLKALAKEVFEANALEGLHQTTGEATKRFLRQKVKVKALK